MATSRGGKGAPERIDKPGPTGGGGGSPGATQGVTGTKGGTTTSSKEPAKGTFGGSGMIADMRKMTDTTVTAKGPTGSGPSVNPAGRPGLVGRIGTRAMDVLSGAIGTEKVTGGTSTPVGNLGIRAGTESHAIAVTAGVRGSGYFKKSEVFRGYRVLKNK